MANSYRGYSDITLEDWISSSEKFLQGSEGSDWLRGRTQEIINATKTELARRREKFDSLSSNWLG